MLGNALLDCSFFPPPIMHWHHTYIAKQRFLACVNNSHMLWSIEYVTSVICMVQKEHMILLVGSPSPELPK